MPQDKGKIESAEIRFRSDSEGDLLLVLDRQFNLRFAFGSLPHLLEKNLKEINHETLQLILPASIRSAILNDLTEQEEYFTSVEIPDEMGHQQIVKLTVHLEDHLFICRFHHDTNHAQLHKPISGQQSEIFLHLVRNLDDAICISDDEGAILFANALFRKHFFGTDEKVGMSFQDALKRLNPENGSATVLLPKSGKKVGVKLFSYDKKEVLDFEYYCLPNVEENHRSYSVHVFSEMLIVPPQLEQFSENEMKYRRLIDSSDDIYFVSEVDNNGVLILKEVSERIKILAGYDPLEIIGQPTISFYGNSTDQELIRKELLEKGVIHEKDLLMLHRDGHYIWTSYSARAYMENGRMVIRGIMKDISKRKNAEIMLRERESFYRALIENSLEIVAIIESTGVIKFISTATKAIMDYHPVELIGKNVFEFFHPEERQQAIDSFTRRAIEGGIGRRLDWRVRTKSNEYRWLSVMINNLMENESVSGMVVNAIDVTDRFKAETQLHLSNARLEKLNLVNQLLLVSNSINDILDGVVQTLMEDVVKCDFGQIVIGKNSPLDNKHIPVYSAGYTIERVVMEIPTNFEDHELTHGKYTYIEDVFAKEILTENELYFHEKGIRSYVCFPLEVHGQIVAALRWGSKKPSFFSKDVLEFIDVVIVQVLLGINDIMLKEELLNSRMEQNAIIAANPDLVIRLNNKGIFLDVYGKHFKQLFKDHNNIISKSVEEVFPFYAAMMIQQNIKKSLHENQIVEGYFEMFYEGYVHFFEARISPLKTDQAILVIREVTEKMNAERSLKTRTIALEESPDGIFIVEKSSNTIVYVNHSFKEIIGNSIPDLVGMKFFGEQVTEMFAPWMSVLLDENEQESALMAMREGKKYLKEIQFKNEDSFRYLMFTLYSVDEGEEKISYVGLVRDISALKILEKKLLASVVEAQEEEQKRIAADLHDGLGQTLTAVNLHFNALINTHEDIQHTELAETTSKLIHRAIQDTRQISHSFMPSSLEKFGLVQTMNNLVDSYNRLETGIKIRFVSFLEDDVFINPSIEIALYRIFQELLNNSVKHSKATEFRVILRMEDEKIVLQCEDNGIGYNPKEVSSGIGLNNIKVRVRFCNGSILTESGKGKGTINVVRVPTTLNPNTSNYEKGSLS
ncbi:MAG: PAS domain S-box protein [Flavobacteriales bacterium]|nr:PAS domain S-box protein [Flavobacteriales bacterium]